MGQAYQLGLIQPLQKGSRVRHFTKGHGWLSGYIDYTAATEAPRAFHLWTGIWTLAGVLRRNVWRDELIYQWTPNFYIILVGPAGVVTKSTTARIGMRLLEQVPGVDFGPNSLTWQALTTALEQAAKYSSYTDAHGEEHKMPMAALNIIASELGTLLRMEDTQLVDVLVDLWDGQLSHWRRETKTSGKTDIENPWLNIIGATTPAWLSENFPVAHIGGGFTSRIIFVYGDKKEQYIAYPSQHQRSEEHKELERKLVEDLQHIAKIAGPFEITGEAVRWGAEWYQRHWDERPLHMASDRFEGYRARKQTHMHKIAMILAISRSDKLVIEKHDLEVADQMLVEVEKDMIKVFESIGLVDESRRVTEILAFVEAYGWISESELWRRVQNLMPYKEYEEALKIAVVHSKRLKIETRNGVKGITRRK